MSVLPLFDGRKGARRRRGQNIIDLVNAAYRLDFAVRLHCIVAGPTRLRRRAVVAGGR